MATDGASGIQGCPLWDRDEEKSNVHKMETEMKLGGGGGVWKEKPRGSERDWFRDKSRAWLRRSPMATLQQRIVFLLIAGGFDAEESTYCLDRQLLLGFIATNGYINLKKASNII